MPAPVRTGREQIVAAGGRLLDRGGPDAVTMQGVADQVGVRAPSLYKHVRDRGDLLAEVVAAAMADLAVRLEGAHDPDPHRSIVGQARALRRFAHARPHAYRLAFGDAQGVPRPRPEALDRAVRPLLEATTALLGPRDALHGARFLTAWANGFITMELAGALRLGGDIDAAWEWGLQRAVAAVVG